MAAKQTITPIVAAQVPGVPVEPAVNCVIDNATAPEILTLAAGGATGDTAGTSRLVAEIVARPGTTRCIARRGLPGVLGRLG